MVTDRLLKKKWEERAAEKGISLESVLYRGFGPSLNRYVHEWHLSSIRGNLLPLVRPGALVLDMACGFGRIRAGIIESRPDLRIVGMDFSETYCKTHTKTFCAETICADMQRLPFQNGVFDVVLGVTALMYLPPENRKTAIAGMMSILRPGGFAFFIDPGREFMQLARKVFPASGDTPTGGDGFLLAEYRALVPTSQGKTRAIGGIPLFTVLLPVLFRLRNRPRLAEPLLRGIRNVDFRMRRPLSFSLQRWVLIEKNLN
jgi:SAM-dependent methyltransferase